MARFLTWMCIFVLGCSPIAGIILVVPDDVPAAFATIFGFSPRLILGNDNRLGFGFRLGNHADFQLMYELGPQITTKPLQPVKVRSATYRQRIVRRRPLLDLLFNLGFLKEASYELNVVNDNDEPR